MRRIGLEPRRGGREGGDSFLLLLTYHHSLLVGVHGLIRIIDSAAITGVTVRARHLHGTVSR